VLFFNSISGIAYDEASGEAMAKRSGISRREVLTGAAGAAAAASLSGLAGCFSSVDGHWPDASPDSFSTCGCAPPDDAAAPVPNEQPGPKTGASAVATIQRADSIDQLGKSITQPYLDVVKDMVDAVLSALAGGADNPWPVIVPSIGPCTRVGLKVNCLNPSFPTSPAVTRALISSLVGKAGVCPGNIIVWDRQYEEMQNASHYTEEHLQGAQLVGTIQSPKDLHGPGYSREEFGTFEGATPHLSRIFTDLTDVTINCPVLKTHGQSGVTGALKNIYGIINIPSTYHSDKQHPDVLARNLPALYNIPKIRNRIKLTVVDALQAVTLGDTADRPDYLPARIFASTDPLALDHYALDLINQLRTKRKQPGVDTGLLGWLDNAHQLGLGTKDYTLVDLSPPEADGGTSDGGGASDDGGADPDAALTP
jgi:uncharacterized protein (DUF362 family)